MQRHITIGDSRFLRALIFAGIFVTIILLSSGAARAQGFTDTETHWSSGAVERWVGLEVISGVTETEFYPDNSITRAEYLTLINRAFGATLTTDISRYTDVSADDWYYEEIAKAYKMGTTNGTSATQMSPGAKISRQDAVVLLARTLGIATGDYSSLQAFSDAESVSTYARPYVAAFVTQGFLNGFDGTLAPLSELTRAQAVTILNNIFRTVAVNAEEEINGSNGSLLIRTPGVTVTGVISGDLIIGDGVGTGDVFIRACTITGRLVIRGGGEQSVKMIGSSARSGVYVRNPTGTTRLVLEDSAAGNVTALTSLIFQGSNASAISVPSGISQKPAITISSGTLDTLNVDSPADITLSTGTIRNMNFQMGADYSTVGVGTGARVTNLSIDAVGVTVKGGGSISELNIGAAGAVVPISPVSYYIGDNLSAVINGVTRYGRSDAEPTGIGSNVSRSSSSLYVSQNSSKTGVSGLSISTTTGEGANTVFVAQTTSAKIQTSYRNNRLAYWLGFFIPSPTDYTGTATVTYYYEGSAASIGVATMVRNGQRGIELLIPVTRYDDGSYSGELDNAISIRWNSAVYETINFKSDTLSLQTLTSSEENTLVAYFRNTNFSSYNNTSYSGSEAIRRLLAADNALGLDTRNYRATSVDSMRSVATILSGESDVFTSRDIIQERLLLAMAGEGALYAINRAATAEQIKRVIEQSDFGYQIGLDEARLSKYYTLSQAGRLSVAKTILTSRGTDYESEQALINVFVSAVDTVRTNESTLIAAINSTKTAAELQKLIETKANSLLLDIVTDANPYKDLSAGAKVLLAEGMFAKLPFSGLDTIRTSFHELIGSPSIIPPVTESVQTVSAMVQAVTLEVGAKTTISPIVTTNFGTDTTPSAVTFSVNNVNVASVGEDGVVTALTKGNVTVTMTSVKDPTKKGTVAVSVVEPVAATAMALSRTSLEVGENSAININVSLTPATSTSTVIWSSDNDAIATVEGTGKNAVITGIKAGTVNISARCEKEGLSAFCAVTVVSADAGVVIYPETVTVGVATSRSLTAVVAPITRANRTVKWTSDDPSIARVDPTGGVIGVAVGTTKVRATSNDDPTLYAECEVIVDATIKGLTVSKQLVTLYRGGSEAIFATVVPGGGNDVVEWAFDSKYIMVEKVDDNTAMLTGIAAGKSTLTAYLRDDSTISVTCEVEVLSTAITTKINKTTATMYIGGDDEFLSVAFTPSNIGNKTVTWSSDSPHIVSVNENGRLTVTATEPGEAMITAIPQANQAEILTCLVKVLKVPVQSVTVSPSSIELKMEATVQLIASIKPENASIKEVVWTTNRQGVVDVNRQTGFVTANDTTYSDQVVGVDENGNDIKVPVDSPAKITATVDGKEAVCYVSVTPGNYVRVEEVEIDLTTWIFPAGQTLDRPIPLIFNKGAALETLFPSERAVTWTSDDETVVTFDAEGRPTFHKPGITSITVLTNNLKSNTKQLIVADTGITGINYNAGVDYTNATSSFGNWTHVGLGAVRMISAAPKNTNAITKGFSWESKDPTVAKIDSQTGQLTGVSPGWARIVVTPIEPARWGGQSTPASSNVIRNKAGDNEANNPNHSPVHSGITTTVVGGETKYKDPNDKELSSTTPIPLVVFNEITDGSGEFWVAVGEADPQAEHKVTLTAPDEIYKDTEFTVTAALNWGNSEASSAVMWSATGNNSNSGDKTVSGKCTAKYSFNTAGEHTITVDITVPEIIGTRGTVLQKGQTLTGELTVTVLDTASPAAQQEFDPQSITGIVIPVAPIAVELRETAYIPVGENLLLYALTTPSGADTSGLIWSSSDETVATVSDGVVSGVSEGTATITVTDYSGIISDSCEVTVRLDEKPVRALVLGNNSFKLSVGDSHRIVANINPINATIRSVTWISSDPSIATVSTSGLVTAVSKGKVEITAITDSGGFKAKCTVTVEN